MCSASIFENSMTDALLHKEHTSYREIGQRAVAYTLERAAIPHTPEEVRYLVGCIEKLECFPDVPEALARLKTRYKIVVLSNGDPDMLEAAEHIPRMKGRDLFKAAVLRLPVVIRDVCRRHGVALDDIDWFIGHQANDRINQALREVLRVPHAKMPSNIARYGNTSSATIPILVDELLRTEQVRRGQLVCFLALGADLNWGAALMRL